MTSAATLKVSSPTKGCSTSMEAFSPASRPTARINRIRTRFSAHTRATPAPSQSSFLERGPCNARAMAPPMSRKPRSPLAPEHAEAMVTRKPSPWATRNVLPSPATGAARGTSRIDSSTAVAVSSESGSSRRATRPRKGIGHASSRNSTAALVRHSMRTPKSSASTPATKSGMVSRSIRHSQYMADIRDGSTTRHTRATTTRGTPTMRSRWRSWMSSSPGRGRARYPPRAAAIRGTRPR